MSNILNMGQYTGDKWLIDGTKHSEDNQSLEFPVNMT